MKFLQKLINRPVRHENDVSFSARQQLEKNRKVIESLKAYDEGKKDISTSDIERRVRGLRSSI